MKPSVPKLFVALVAGMVSLGVSAADAGQARLLLTVVVDGLDADYLSLLADNFGEGGFKRLERDGALLMADYGPGMDAAAATVTLVTGAAPSASGVSSATRYDRENMRVTSLFRDPDVLGNFTTVGYSPATLRVSTIADEARIAAGGVNVVYAVAPSPVQAIALAGHAANSALWLDHKTGNWASSTYYKEMPVATATRNRTVPLTSRLDTMSWTPTLAPDAFQSLPA